MLSEKVVHEGSEEWQRVNDVIFPPWYYNIKHFGHDELSVDKKNNPKDYNYELFFN